MNYTMVSLGVEEFGNGVMGVGRYPTKIETGSANGVSASGQSLVRSIVSH